MEILRLVFSPIEVNTFILTDESGKCAVIDCGCYDDIEFSRFKSILEKRKLLPEILLNTHCHLDHIFGNNMMLNTYGLNALCHSDDEVNRKDSPVHASLFGLEMEMPPEPQKYIADGQLITFGSVTLIALHVPGHSPGSLAFYSKKDGVVFTGDALFSGSIGRTDLPGGDYDTLIKSIRNKLFILPPETIVWPGHGEKTTIGHEMKTNPFFI